MTDQESIRGFFTAFSTLHITAYALAGTLGILSVLAWLTVARANMPMAGTLDMIALIFFTVMWGVGMVAMMFPSLLPMIYTVAVSARKSIEESNSSPSTKKLLTSIRSSLFIAGYVAIWTLVGVVFYVAVASLSLAGILTNPNVVGLWAAAILIFVGSYQFTRFKQRALMKCRSPMGFILTRWKNGNAGACAMGVDYGFFCTKCCWVLMAGLLVVGAMSLPLMGIFTIIIFAEKLAPFGATVSRIVGAGFVAMGLYLLI